MLSPIMHPNLAQITRTWIAASLLSGTLLDCQVKKYTTLPNLIQCPTTSMSIPSNIIQWNLPTNFSDDTILLTSETEGATQETHTSAVIDKTETKYTQQKLPISRSTKNSNRKTIQNATQQSSNNNKPIHSHNTLDKWLIKQPNHNDLSKDTSTLRTDRSIQDMDYTDKSPSTMPIETEHQC
jgi:hypothetical protein